MAAGPADRAWHPASGSGPYRRAPAPAARVARRAPARRPAAGRLPDAVPRDAAWTSPTCASTSRATTCATSTGTSPRGWTRPTSASTSRTARSRLAAARPSASMGFGPVDRQKSLVLAEIATTIAHILARGGNRIGAALFDGGIETIPPGQGRNQVLRISQALLRPPSRAALARPKDHHRTWHHRPASCCGRPRAGPAPLAAGHRLGLHHPAGLGAAAVAAGPTPRRRRHPGGRPARVRAARGGHGLRRGRRDRRADLRRHQRPGLPASGCTTAAAERQDALVAAARRSGTEIHPVATDDDLVRALARISELRRRRRR